MCKGEHLIAVRYELFGNKCTTLVFFFFLFFTKLLYSYLKFNGEWLLQQLKVSPIELSEHKLLSGQKIKGANIALLQSMFHIGQQPFDRVSFG